jgi:hypothetical protein
MEPQLPPVPEHLARYPWYKQHLAYLRSNHWATRHDPGATDPRRAVLIGADLTGADLSGADLSCAVLTRADLSGAVFTRANLTGADLRHARIRRADLRHAEIRRADLKGVILSNANLADADLYGADLTGADLSGAVLTDASLAGANLTGADVTDAVLSGIWLHKADLWGARGLPHAPRIERIDRQILERIVAGNFALDMTAWHSECGTARFRGGHAIDLAGEEGYALEERYGPWCAAALIYAASRPRRRVPDFRATDDDAMDDLRRCVAEDEYEQMNPNGKRRTW